MGRVFKFHNDVDTDQIIASQYLLLPNIEEMKVYTFESIDKDFAKKVKEGDIVEPGDKITEGSISPKELLSVASAEAVENYILKEVQQVYRLQGIEISDKHIEIIITV